MVTLDVDETTNFLERRENLQPIRVNFDVPRPERKITKHLLVTVERLIQNFQRSFDDRAVFVLVDVSRVYDSLTLARLGTGSVARDALSVLCHFVRWARSHTGSVILEQMFRAVPYAGCSVGVFALGIRLPEVVCWVVTDGR